MTTIETTNLLKVAEAAKILGVSRATTYRLIATGELPAVRIGRALKVDRAELNEYIYGCSGAGAPDLLTLDEVAERIGAWPTWCVEARFVLPCELNVSTGEAHVRAADLPLWRRAWDGGYMAPQAPVEHVQVSPDDRPHGAWEKGLER